VHTRVRVDEPVGDLGGNTSDETDAKSMRPWPRKNRVISWGLLLLEVDKGRKLQVAKPLATVFGKARNQNQPQLLSLRAAANQHSNDFVGP
jgi:hypothetical protein